MFSKILIMDSKLALGYCFLSFPTQLWLIRNMRLHLDIVRVANGYHNLVIEHMAHQFKPFLFVRRNLVNQVLNIVMLYI